MKFKEIRIRLMEYGEFNGKVVATLSIEGKAADMQITIPEPHSLRILQACGEIVAEAGQVQAAKFREEFMAAISPQNPAVTGDSEAGVRCRGVVGTPNQKGEK